MRNSSGTARNRRMGTRTRRTTGRSNAIRYGAGFGAAVGAALLAMVSVAYACTTFRGVMTLEVLGTGQSGGSSTATGFNSGSHSYCTGGLPKGDAQIDTNSARSAGNHATPVGWLKISLGPATTCLTGGQNKLSAGSYDVAILNGTCTASCSTTNKAAGFTGTSYSPTTSSSSFSWNWNASCGPVKYPIADGGTSPNGTKKLSVGIEVGSNGTGFGLIPVTLGDLLVRNTPSDATAVCVNQRSGGTDGHQVPLFVI